MCVVCAFRLLYAMTIFGNYLRVFIWRSIVLDLFEPSKSVVVAAMGLLILNFIYISFNWKHFDGNRFTILCWAWWASIIHFFLPWSRYIIDRSFMINRLLRLGQKENHFGKIIAMSSKWFWMPHCILDTTRRVTIRWKNDSSRLRCMRNSFTFICELESDIRSENVCFHQILICPSDATARDTESHPMLCNLLLLRIKKTIRRSKN